jgi:hypothetical protein
MFTYLLAFSVPLRNCLPAYITITYHLSKTSLAVIPWGTNLTEQNSRVQRDLGYSAFASRRSFFFKFLEVGWDWVHSVCRPLTGLLYQPRMRDDESGAVGGMRIGRGSRSTRRKPAPIPLWPLQVAHDLTWARTRAAVVGSRWLTSWVMARPFHRRPAVKTETMNCVMT